MPRSINEKSKDVTSAPESGTRDKQVTTGKGTNDPKRVVSPKDASTVAKPKTK